MSEITKRCSSIFSKISQSNSPDAIFVFNKGRVDKNFFYLTGLYQGVYENCGFLFERNGKSYLLTTALEEELSMELEGYAEILVYKNDEEKNAELKKVLSGYKKIGVCYETVSHQFFLQLRKTFKGIEWVDVGKAFAKSRMIKSEGEIEKIKKSCSIVSEVAEDIPGILKAGMSELDLSAEIDYLVKKKGAHGVAFKTIVAFGANTSKPHYNGGAVKLKNGDVILADFGAEYRGYNSDITQTYLTGKPEREVIDLYNTVHKTQKLAIDLIHEGISTEYVDKEVRKYIDNHEAYKGRFIHSLGHSLGLDVHDDVYPSSDYKKKFLENMVLTVEPGVYLPGFCGVRLEDDIVVKRESCDVLTTAKKELITYDI